MKLQAKSSLFLSALLLTALFSQGILILTASLSPAQEAKKVQRSNPTEFSSASLKTIIVGDYYPYTFVNDQGIPDGFSVDMAKAVVRVMDLKLEIKVDTWEQATKALTNGTIDFLPMMAASPKREKFFDFSVPHTIAYDALFLRTGTPRIRSLKDLDNKTVIVMNKDTAHDYLLSSGMAARMKLVLVNSLPEALRTLAAGQGDAALMPKLVGLIIMKKLNLTNLDPSPVVIDAYKRPFCFAVKEGNQVLLERLSQGLSIIKTTGEYQEIYQKWFGALEPPGLTWRAFLKTILWTAAVFTLLGLGLLFWTISLRKQVAWRTRSLETEILERKKVAEALRESEKRYHSLFENMLEGFAYCRVVYDQGRPIDVIYLDVNIAFESLTGLKDVIGKKLSEVLPGIQETDPELFEIYGRVALTGNPERFEFYSKALKQWLSLSVYSSEKEYFMAVFDVITERKRAEAEIHQLNIELEQRVEERTVELEARNRELEAFTYSVSHDLKAPLRGIDGYGRLLAENYGDRLDEEGRLFLNNLLRSVTLMNQLIDDLLAYSRLERRSMTKGTIQLEDFVKKIICERQDDILRRNVQVKVDIPCGPVKSDQEGLSQVLRNLLDNALKFTGQTDKPSIEIGGQESEKGCILWVKDNGVGFDLKYMDRIFQIFQRLERTEDFPGTGIGLAIVRKVMERIGGRVWAESEPGKGATFLIEIPNKGALK